MNESLFQYIWHQQLFNTDNLRLTNGEPIEIFFPGIPNVNQGPDFLEARIRISHQATWIGQVELHIRASDWFRHFHNEDSNYENVILHVVWDNDQLIFEDLPTLVLQDRVAGMLINRYDEWMNMRSFIPCENMFSMDCFKEAVEFTNRLVSERLSRKSARISSELSLNKPHWEEVLWCQIARVFGGTINGEAFEAMFRSIPFKVFMRHKHQIHQLESLMFGQCGLLNDPCEDDYVILLQREYGFLKKKYQLTPVKIPLHFLRMRPKNFPTIRLAQLAMLMHCSTISFNYFRELEDIVHAKSLFEITANDFWHYHYSLKDTSDFQPKKTGNDLIWSVIINAIIPVLSAYASFHKDALLQNKMEQWLSIIPAETNKVVKGFKALGLQCTSAFQSQSLIELKQQYCDKKKCLECMLGKKFLHLNS